MIYEFHDDKHGTAEEKCKKAYKALKKYFYKRFKHRRAVGVGEFDFFVWNDERLGVLVEASREIKNYNLLDAKENTPVLRIEFTHDQNILNDKNPKLILKYFDVAETCCDMFDRGLM